MTYVGIDPGKAGGVAILTELSAGVAVRLHAMPDDHRALWALLKSIRGESVAVIEQPFVHVGGPMGPRSAFNFGGSYFTARAFLIAAEIPFEDVPPQHWMKAMECMTGGDKNVSKRKALELFPGLGITLATADALLIAEFARRSGIVTRPAMSAAR